MKADLKCVTSTSKRPGGRSFAQNKILKQTVQAQREFQKLRARVIPKAQAQGFFTDEDIFKVIS